MAVAPATSTGAPYEVVATCGCGVQVLVCSLHKWVPTPGYKCGDCRAAEDVAAQRRANMKPVKPGEPLPAMSDGPYSQAAQQLGLLT